VARCQVDYTGRLSAHLPMATRLLIWKAYVTTTDTSA
jgi:endonuclease